MMSSDSWCRHQFLSYYKAIVFVLMAEQYTLVRMVKSFAAISIAVVAR